MLFIEFASETQVNSIGVLNVQGSKSYVTIVYYNGDVEVVEKIIIVG